MSMKTVVVTSGENFPDGLAGASLAGKNNGILLLVPKTEVANEINFLSKNKASIETCYILGSSVAVSDQIKNQIDAALYD